MIFSFPTFQRTGKEGMITSFYYDKGDFAPSQQDALVLEVLAFGKREAALLAVCDGIGGLKEGEYASSYVTMRLRNWFYDSCLKHIRKGHSRKLMERELNRMLYDCNRYLQLYGKEHGIRLGTTMTMAVILGNSFSEGEASGRWLCLCPRFGIPLRYTLFHVGDSRAYKIGKKCKKLTGDDSGEGHTLRRCIGSFAWQGVQKRRGLLFCGQKLLLCSDGFWRQLREREFTESIGEAGGFSGRQALTETQLEKRLGKLGQTARARGERDNQSAVVCGLR